MMTACATSPTLAWMGRNARLGWLIALAMLFIPPIYWAFDYEPPFEVLSIEPASARPGEWVYLHMQVRRDVARECSATYSRAIITPAGVRLDIVNKDALLTGKDRAISTAEQIANYEKRFPGELHIGLQVPPEVGPGKAVLVTSLHYVCNPLQELWPLRMFVQMPFNVLPPA